jgi:hypothetical protein
MFPPFFKNEIDFVTAHCYGLRVARYGLRVASFGFSLTARVYLNGYKTKYDYDLPVEYPSHLNLMPASR